MLFVLLLIAGTAAALCIQRQGAIPSMPTRVELEKEIAARASGGGGGGGGGSSGGGGSKASQHQSKAPPLPRQTFW